MPDIKLSIRFAPNEEFKGGKLDPYDFSSAVEAAYALPLSVTGNEEGNFVAIYNSNDLPDVPAPGVIGYAQKWIATELNVDIEELPCFINNENGKVTKHKDGSKTVTFAY